jgi:hypothetical protein
MVLGDDDPGNPGGNPKGIGNTRYTSNAEFDTQFDIIMDLLSGDVIASSLDHINEGIHNASNNYMQNAHKWVKAHALAGTPITMTYNYAVSEGAPPETETATKKAAEWIQAALARVATPQPGSPGAERLISRDAGENHSASNGHDLDERGCVDGGELLFCEYAVLNKGNTHESRVHHVETPGGIVGDPDFEFVDVGFVWITELAFQLNKGNYDVQGMVGNQDITDLGIPRPAGSTNVNNDITYSLAILATSSNGKRARQFVDFLRSPLGQEVYTDGGFTGLTATQLEGGRCYTEPEDGVSVETIRNGDGSCDDWLNNN